MRTDRATRPAGDGLALEPRQLPASLIVIGAHGGAKVELANQLGADWASEVKLALDHLDIPGVIDVEFRSHATSAYGWIGTELHGSTFLGQSQGSAPYGGLAQVNLAMANRFGVDPVRVIVHETAHLLQPRTTPNSGHTDDPASIMYRFGVPVALYAAYGVDPSKPYVLSEADRSTYVPFWRNHTPFLLATASVPSGPVEVGGTASVSLSARGFVVGITESLGVVDHPGGTLRFPIPPIGAGETWTKTISLPVTASGPLSFRVEGAIPAIGSWPERTIVAKDAAPEPFPARVTVGINAPSRSMPGTVVTIPITVVVGSGRLGDGALVVTSPAGVQRVAIPPLATGSRWTHRLVVSAPNATWRVEAVVEGARATGSERSVATVFAMRQASPPPTTQPRRVWTARHASLFATLRRTAAWKSQPASLIAEEVHRQLGT